MLDNRCSDLISGNLYPLTNIFPFFPHPPVPGNHHSIISITMISELLDYR